jgi:hypothetical protein
MGYSPGCLEEEFSETGLPVYGNLGNSGIKEGRGSAASIQGECYDTYITGPEFTVLTIHGLDQGRGSFSILNTPGLYSCSQGHEDAPGRAAGAVTGTEQRGGSWGRKRLSLHVRKDHRR